MLKNHCVVNILLSQNVRGLRGAYVAGQLGGGGGLLGILGGGVVPAGSPNPDPVSDQKMSFSTPVIRPDPQNPYTFSDLAFRQKLCHHYLD